MAKRILKNLIYIVVCIAVFCIVWTVSALIADSPLIFPDIPTVLKEIGTLFSTQSFYVSTGLTVLRSVLSFLLSFLVALILSLAVNLFKIKRGVDFVVTFLRSVPTISIILLCLVVFPSKQIPYIVSFLVAFPVMYASFVQSIASQNGLSEMCSIFSISKFNQVANVYLPSLKDDLFAQASANLPLCVKIVVAGEALALPRYGLGKVMYVAKNNVDMARLFALTLFALVCCFLLEGFVALIKLAFNGIQKNQNRKKVSTNSAEQTALDGNTPVVNSNDIANAQVGNFDSTEYSQDLATTPIPTDIILNNISVTYNDTAIYNNFNAVFSAGKLHVVLGSSGCGKTTLLNVVANLVKHQGTCITQKPSYVFQEPRLSPISSQKNIEIVLKKSHKNQQNLAVQSLASVNLQGKENQIATTLSGGEQQRVAIARAFAVNRPVLLLDEPFKSLDYKVKNSLYGTLSNLLKQSPKTTLFVTHDIDEALQLADVIYVMQRDPNGSAVLTKVAEISVPRGNRDIYDQQNIELRKQLQQLI